MLIKSIFFFFLFGTEDSAALVKEGPYLSHFSPNPKSKTTFALTTFKVVRAKVPSDFKSDPKWPRYKHHNFDGSANS